MDIQKSSVYVFAFVKGLLPHFKWQQINKRRVGQDRVV